MIRRLAVTLVVLLSMTLLPATHAIAAEPSLPADSDFTSYASHQLSPPFAVPALSNRAELSYTFSKDATQRLYSVFKSGGAAGATAYCIYIVPTPLKPACATMIVILYELTGAPPAENTCYQVYARWGWPPTGGRVVRC